MFRGTEATQRENGDLKNYGDWEKGRMGRNRDSRSTRTGKKNGRKATKMAKDWNLRKQQERKFTRQARKKVKDHT